MRLKIDGDEAHLFGAPKDFNTISRAIRKCRVGTTTRLPIEQSQAGPATLNLICTGTGGSIEYQGVDLLIAFPERLRNQLSPCFSMPAETQAGSMFFISRSQIDFLHDMKNGALNIVLHVV
ncbi:hypothetical protein [Pseudomonas vanderleydeniana]|uniref:Uncharacterized protein n=1 Tax=Pseudomonas vanderleydeniana TaxID=2745495 RepID=A0A9E6TU92_9PSED|nr:hypothetical protein [Pseudomonas vanderleydeniana]QXI30614.1 hypothetical protein HU752_012005 [Pseudomonas vanderleydeniana]